MQVKIKFFALYKEKTKTKDIIIKISENGTLKDLSNLLIKNNPNLSNFKNKFIFAVNYEYQDYEYILKNCDEVALIPPVSGG